jgi:hypothetical protein
MHDETRVKDRIELVNDAVDKARHNIIDLLKYKKEREKRAKTPFE